MSSIWSIAALDLLEYSRRTTFASVEHLQATIIISYVIYNSQGFSPMFRSLHSNMITMAWELSLHKTDSPQMKGQTDPQPSRIEAEVKRRIWWHIASTDWLLAFTPGPLEGTYSIQPSHMRVNHPQDEEDRDHNDGNLALLSTSYFLQRVRLSEICRAVVDSLPQFEDVENVDYRQIISLDGKFEELIKTLPAFFRLDDRSDLYHTAPHLAIQRYLIHLGIHTRRSRLHQSFLVRGFTDQKYAFSRDACLNSSRTVLEICRTLEEEKNSLASIPARLATVVHHLFMATVVLVVDLCSTKVEGFEEQRQAEVTQACRMLDDLKNDSTMAARFLNPLMEILQKHKDRLHHQSAVSARAPTDSRISQSLRDPLRVFHEPLSDIGQDTSANPGGQRAATGQSYADDWEFDHMMQQYIDLGQNIDGPTWNNLFDDFDSYHMSDVGGAIFYG
ncbi:hypothetical protein N7461_003789 [Penicillium sp. DV-2018c]|nr:hypothetical protein N7461_003789 [Penicillium sp. DV-2018c]